MQLQTLRAGLVTLLAASPASALTLSLGKKERCWARLPMPSVLRIHAPRVLLFWVETSDMGKRKQMGLGTHPVPIGANDPPQHQLQLGGTWSHLAAHELQLVPWPDPGLKYYLRVMLD